MNHQGSIYFVIGVAVAAMLLTVVLNESTSWVSMAQISILPTPTFTPIVGPTPTPTNTPVPPTPTPTNTPVPPMPTPRGGSDSVTGKGWFHSPAGAYVEDASLTGEAAFGFVARQKTGASVPTGNGKFKFKRAKLSFSVEAYEQLVVDGYKAVAEGTGKMNGSRGYGFLIAAVDSELAPGIHVDLFRIKIWDENNGGAVVYDSQIDCADLSDDAVPCRAIAGGDIVIGK